MKKTLLLMMVLALVAGFTFANGEGETATAAAPASDVVEDAAMAYFANIDGSKHHQGRRICGKGAAGDDMFVVDIRQPDVYAEGHIDGAVNLPWGPLWPKV